MAKESEDECHISAIGFNRKFYGNGLSNDIEGSEAYPNVGGACYNANDVQL